MIRFGHKVAFLGLLLSAVLAVHLADGHGMMIDPINRSSLWRVNASFPPNYNDNENFCGGFAVQFQQNEGKCGVCGDNFVDPRPRKNENTGTYGLGYVVDTYQAGSTIQVTSLLTANHLGYFQYGVCKLEDPNAPEPGEECFQLLKFADGSDRYSIVKDMKYVETEVVLPEGFTCDRCVLRWHYTAGNNWGECEDGQFEEGCGDQETFRSCADIAIV